MLQRPLTGRRRRSEAFDITQFYHGVVSPRQSIARQSHPRLFSFATPNPVCYIHSGDIAYRATGSVLGAENLNFAIICSKPKPKG